MKVKPKCYSYVRFSTPEQSKGDSRRRQIEKAQKYAQENNLSFDESLTIEDLGLSAFRGKNKEAGSAFGAFIELLKQGKVPVGSVLIVESLDRISREKITEALELFLSILNRGVKIVTLMDGQEFTKESVDKNQYDLFGSLSVMIRANEESETKSKRLKEAFANKRMKINNERYTKICPKWIKPEGDGFIIIEERRKIIERIFRSSLNGMGAKLIAKQLNLEGIAPWGKGMGWQQSYIYKILKNVAVTGAFQPHKMSEGKRLPIGEPIKDYFPQAITEELFYQVQESIKARNGKGGKTGKNNNLFSHIVMCAYCGAPMHFDNKGPRPKGNKYLVCSRAKIGSGCRYISFRYDDFERAFMEHINELNVAELMQDNNQEGRRKQAEHLRGKLAKVNAENETLEKRVSSWLNEFGDSDSATANQRLKQAIEEASEKIDVLAVERTKLKKELQILELRKENMNERLEGLKSLFEELESKQGDDLLDLRRRIKVKIKSLVQRIDVFPEGTRAEKDNIEKHIEMEKTYLKMVSPNISDEEMSTKVYEIKSLYEKLQGDKTNRAFRVHFINGNIKQISPNYYGEDEFMVSVEVDKSEEKTTSIIRDQEMSFD